VSDKEFADRYVLGEGFPWVGRDSVGLYATNDPCDMAMVPLALNGTPPDGEVNPDCPRYRLILERVPGRPPLCPRCLRPANKHGGKTFKHCRAPIRRAGTRP
jgi:hypothetical protein